MSRHRSLKFLVSVAIVLAESRLCFAQTDPTVKPSQLAEFMSRVCPDGWDEDWRPDGPVLVVTGDWRGGQREKDERVSASRTPFVLYGDGTVIAGVVLGHADRFDGWEHTLYHLDPGEVARLKRSLDWDALIKLDGYYRPIRKEAKRWQEIHRCFDACWPYLELHLWAEGCRKTVTIDGLDGLFLQLIAVKEWSLGSAIEGERFALARLALKRLPAGLRRALLRLAEFRSAGGTRWCTDRGCREQELPRHEAWGFRGKVLTIRGPYAAPEGEQTVDTAR